MAQGRSARELRDQGPQTPAHAWRPLGCSRGRAGRLTLVPLLILPGDPEPGWPGTGVPCGSEALPGWSGALLKAGAGIITAAPLLCHLKFNDL